MGKHSLSCCSTGIDAERCYHQSIGRTARESGSCSSSEVLNIDHMSTKYEDYEPWINLFGLFLYDR